MPKINAIPLIPDIMEVTLRDGSYVIDFQFTAEDTATLVSALEGAGFRWIEIGHGLGMNAQDKGKRRAVATDEAHMAAAAQAAQSAYWGMFFIPGIGRAADVDLAAQYNMDFIRIGTNVTDSERARPFIEQAKAHDMFVCYNAMKSYAVTPQAFAQVASEAQSWGADMVYIVDSAGTMLPEDVGAFIEAIKAESDVPIGFHGHDNLSMGMANTLQAIESGAAIVDSSLRGMGRSAGNVITEALLAIMHRRGYADTIDLKATMDISAGMIAPLVPGRGLDTMAITAGLAGFHSSFTTKVQSYAKKYDVDVRDLIVRLCEINRIDAPDDLLDDLGKALAREKQTPAINIPAFDVEQHPDNTPQALTELCEQLYSEAQKYRTYTTLNVVLSQQLAETISIGKHIHTTPTHTIGSVTFSTETQLVEILSEIDGQVDIVLLDIDRRRIFGPTMPALTAADVLTKSQLLVYSDGRVWAGAVKDQIVRLLDEKIQNISVVIAGDHRKSHLLSLMLTDYGADVTMIVRESDEEAELTQATKLFTQSDNPHDRYVDQEQAVDVIQSAKVLVVWSSWGTWLDAEMAKTIPVDTIVIDAGIGSIETSGLHVLHERGIAVIRVHIWATLAGTLLAAHTGSQVHPQQGTVDGVSVVSGGMIGEIGSVVVDDVAYPTQIVGVADGRGGLLPRADSTYADHVRRVTESINNQKVRPNL